MHGHLNVKFIIFTSQFNWYSMILYLSLVFNAFSLLYPSIVLLVFLSVFTKYRAVDVIDG